uniref:Uncharacterized protein n=1 Tax=Strigamia maritima TaxID=126957 RepID=T1J7U3_STRMM
MFILYTLLSRKLNFLASLASYSNFDPPSFTGRPRDSSLHSLPFNGRPRDSCLRDLLFPPTLGDPRLRNWHSQTCHRIYRSAQYKLFSLTILYYFWLVCLFCILC